MRKKRMSVLFYHEDEMIDGEDFKDFIGRMRAKFVKLLNTRNVNILVHPDNKPEDFPVQGVRNIEH